MIFIGGNSNFCQIWGIFSHLKGGHAMNGYYDFKKQVWPKIEPQIMEWIHCDLKKGIKREF